MKLGRNDLCHCGSGKKYKHCCAKKETSSARTPVLPSQAECSALKNLFNAGRFVEVENAASSLLGKYKESGFLWNLLGASLQEQGKDGFAALREAARLLPNDAMVLNNLGGILRDRGERKEAVAYYKKVLQLNPRFAGAYYNLGVVLFDLDQYEDAIINYRKALEVDPNFADAQNNLGVPFAALGQFVEAEKSHRRALEIKRNWPLAQSNLLFTLGYRANYSQEDYFQEACKYGKMLVNKERYDASLYFRGGQENPEKLKIGFVSGDLGAHPVGYFLESFLTQVNSSRIDLIAYPTAVRTSDPLMARIKRHFLEWKPLNRLNDSEAAQLIKADGVHILFDLSGHSAKNRLPLFSNKLAPIQVSWLGYFATTGVAEMDYLLADPIILPHGDEAFYTEHIWRLPDSYLCFTPPDVDVAVAVLPAISNKFVTFGSFNNLNKINNNVIELWAHILNAVSNSRLLLKTKQLGNASVREKTLKKFERYGVFRDRLFLEGAVPRCELLDAYNRVDIALDPFPYPGGTTSAEALWMGVPVLTRRGDRFLSRVGETIAHNCGMSEWIAADNDDYVRKAVTYSSDFGKLAEIRKSLRQHVLASPLFDAPRFSKNFEDAMWGMWQAWTDKQNGKST
jgi:predicted O-linked N-acetylglucosamine transferase (SPINDLY family)